MCAKSFFKGKFMCALSFLVLCYVMLYGYLCALISRPVRAHTRAQLRGNIGSNPAVAAT